MNWACIRLEWLRFIRQRRTWAVLLLPPFLVFPLLLVSFWWAAGATLWTSFLLGVLPGVSSVGETSVDGAITTTYAFARGATRAQIIRTRWVVHFAAGLVLWSSLAVLIISRAEHLGVKVNMQTALVLAQAGHPPEFADVSQRDYFNDHVMKGKATAEQVTIPGSWFHLRLLGLTFVTFLIGLSLANLLGPLSRGSWRNLKKPHLLGRVALILLTFFAMLALLFGSWWGGFRGSLQRKEIVFVQAVMHLDVVIGVGLVILMLYAYLGLRAWNRADLP